MYRVWHGVRGYEVYGECYILWLVFGVPLLLYCAMPFVFISIVCDEHRVYYKIICIFPFAHRPNVCLAHFLCAFAEFFAGIFPAFIFFFLF